MDAEKIKAERFFLVNLGCPKNLVDSENLSLELMKRGLVPVSDPEEAEIIVINTCGFIKEARAMSLNYSRAFERSGKKLIITGCLPKRIGTDEVRKKVSADFIIPDWRDIPALIKNKRTKKAGNSSRNGLGEYMQNVIRINTLSPFSAYVKISEGCSRLCSFCSIPFIRGYLNSRKEEDILNEIRYLAQNGVKEFILVSQDTTMWGVDLYKDRSSLLRLLDKISEIDGVEWIRLFYIYPDTFAEKLIDYISSNDKIVRYIEMPFQHFDDEILQSMGRATRQKLIRKIMDKIKEKLPDLSLRTELIVGFPGETEEKFRKILEFMQTYEFDWVGVFEFSPEEGTKAYELWKSNPVPKSVVKRRKREVISLFSEILEKKQKQRVGRRFSCIFERENTLRAYFQAPEIDGVVRVKMNQKEIKPFYEVKITSFKGPDLTGEIIV